MRQGSVGRRAMAVVASAAMLATAAGPVVAASDLDFGNVVVGESASVDQDLPLVSALSELPPDAVLYAGGDGTIDFFLGGYGLTPPVTAGDLYAAFGEATASYHLALSVPAGTPFTVDDGDCGTATVSCTATVGFSPQSTGPHSEDVTVTASEIDITFGPGYPAEANLLELALATTMGDAIGSGLSFVVDGNGTNGGSGGVTLKITVPEPPAPCVILDTGLLDFGTLGFSTEGTPSSGSRALAVSSCSTGDQEVLANATDATGDGTPPATWALSDAGGNPCNAGIGQYGLLLTGNTGGGPEVLQLSTASSPWLSLDVDASAATTVEYQMPCEGSGGAGQTMTSQITFVATMP